MISKYGVPFEYILSRFLNIWKISRYTYSNKLLGSMVRIMFLGSKIIPVVWISWPQERIHLVASKITSPQNNLSASINHYPDPTDES